MGNGQNNIGNGEGIMGNSQGMMANSQGGRGNSLDNMLSSQDMGTGTVRICRSRVGNRMEGNEKAESHTTQVNK